MERVVLAEEIKLPKSESDWRDIKAKFFFPIMSPLMDSSSAKDKTQSAPDNKNVTGDKLNASKYTSANYVELYIPRYLLSNFNKREPYKGPNVYRHIIIEAGTEFLVASVGGSIKLNHLRIIGLYTMPMMED